MNISVVHYLQYMLNMHISITRYLDVIIWLLTVIAIHSECLQKQLFSSSYMERIVISDECRDHVRSWTMAIRIQFHWTPVIRSFSGLVYLLHIPNGRPRRCVGSGIIRCKLGKLIGLSQRATSPSTQGNTCNLSCCMSSDDGSLVHRIHSSASPHGSIFSAVL